MTVSTTTSAVVYTGTGTTATYAYTWGIAQSTDLIAYTIDATGSTVTKLTNGVDFTVTGAGIPTGGTIVLTAGNLANGVRLFIGSDPAQVQALLLAQGAAFNPSDVMSALDLLTREVQATRRIANNALQIPTAESLDGYALTLPTKSQRASKIVAFDANGNVIASGGTGGIAISGAMTPVVQAATLGAGRTALGGVTTAVSTIAALKALGSTDQVGDVLVEGYATAGDGGGGVFRWNSSDATADNGGTVIQPNSLPSTGRWNRVGGYLTVFNVRAFGAKGDGTTDDTTALQKAVSALNTNGGGILYYPNGTYLITGHAPVQTGNVIVCGDGPGASTIKVGAWVDGLRVSDASYPSASSILKNVTIRDLCIDGNRAGWTRGANDTYGNGINLNSCDNVLVQNVRVLNPSEQGILSTYWSVASSVQQSVVYDSCIVENPRDSKQGLGIEGQSRSARIVNCTVTGAGTGCQAVYVGYISGSGTGQGECVIANNRIVGNAGSTGQGIKVEDNVYNAVIANNVIDGFDIGIRCSSNTQSTFDYLINSNVVLGWITAGICTFPMNGTDKCRTVISGNKIISANASGSSYGILAGASCTITGNRIEGTAGNTPGEGIACGNNSFVAANEIRSTGYSVDLGTNTGCTVVGNFFNGDINDGAAFRANVYFANYGGTTVRANGWYVGPNMLHTYGNAAPTTGTHALGEVVWNGAPASAGFIGWVCVSAGTPGTWKTFGTIS